MGDLIDMNNISWEVSHSLAPMAFEIMLPWTQRGSRCLLVHANMADTVHTEEHIQ